MSLTTLEVDVARFGATPADMPRCLAALKEGTTVYAATWFELLRIYENTYI